jgi:hypothetical protein
MKACAFSCNLATPGLALLGLRVQTAGFSLAELAYVRSRYSHVSLVGPSSCV